MNKPGRSCPLDYSIEKNFFLKKENEISCDTIYVVGGLYGNYQALSEIINLSLKEKENTTIIFNGDIHWFDKNLNDFKNIEKEVINHIPLLGNVEAELIRKKDINIGCGCSYPSCVDDDSVNRSNEIHRLMKNSMCMDKNIIKSLSERKKALVAKIDNIRIAITHGDEKSLAGWLCSRENLSNIERQKELNMWFNKNNISILATTHTCSPAAITINNNIVINNGAAGMPNFKNTKYGLITRISKNACKDALYRTKKDNLYVEAIPVNYDFTSFVSWFDKEWNNNSPASISYRDRILNGTYDEIKDAIINGFELV